MKIDIRSFILDNSESIKKLLPSKKQSWLIKAIRQRTAVTGQSCTAFDLSVETETTIQNASTRLKNLYNMGWLDRERMKDPTGGYCYGYFTKF